ncbi:hypothetical protein GCM10023215_08120 [Pseudonocardia yuanmonensis]|uniref:Uncharacterized protein n=1 Tax=Pseudonocardia yuanmonensis TaxID=1095914 RepID=A0ABP8W0C2_9PSEU
MNALLSGRPERTGPEDRDDGTRGTGGDGPRGHPGTGSTALPSRAPEEERRPWIDASDGPDAWGDLDGEAGDEEHVLAALYGDEADLDAPSTRRSSRSRTRRGVDPP